MKSKKKRMCIFVIEIEIFFLFFVVYYYFLVGVLRNNVG